MKAKKKIIFAIIGSVLLISLTLFWTFMAIIQVHKQKSSDGFGGYRGTKIIAIYSENYDFSDSKIDGLKCTISPEKDGKWVITDSNTAVEEFLELCSEKNITAFIEIDKKSSISEKDLSALCETAIQSINYSSLIISSENPSSIEFIKKNDSYIKTFVLSPSPLKSFAYAQMGFSVNLDASKASESIIKRIHNNYNFVCVYNSSMSDYYDLSALFVDYMIID